MNYDQCKYLNENKLEAALSQNENLILFFRLSSFSEENDQVTQFSRNHLGLIYLVKFLTLMNVHSALGTFSTLLPLSLHK